MPFASVERGRQEASFSGEIRKQGYEHSVMCGATTALFPFPPQLLLHLIMLKKKKKKKKW